MKINIQIVSNYKKEFQYLSHDQKHYQVTIDQSQYYLTQTK